MLENVCISYGSAKVNIEQFQKMKGSNNTYGNEIPQGFVSTYTIFLGIWRLLKLHDSFMMTVSYLHWLNIVKRMHAYTNGRIIWVRKMKFYDWQTKGVNAIKINIQKGWGWQIDKKHGLFIVNIHIAQEYSFKSLKCIILNTETGMVQVVSLMSNRVMHNWPCPDRGHFVYRNRFTAKKTQSDASSQRHNNIACKMNTNCNF